MLPSGPLAWRGLPFSMSPLLVVPSNASRRAIQELRRVLNRPQSIPEGDTLESVLTSLCSRQYMGLVCRTFDEWEVADGRWFKRTEPERTRSKTRRGKSVRSPPAVVENNVYGDAGNKEARMVINTLWLLTSGKAQCSAGKARRLLAKYAG